MSRTIRHCPRLEACFGKLQCLHFDKNRNGWVWHYDDEARSLKFEQPWKDVSKHGAVVLGTFFIRGSNAAELYVRSIERALMAIAFFDEYVPRTVARINDLDVANRLFSADERDHTPETLFAAAETDLRQQAVDREALLANPRQILADFEQQYSGAKRKQLPELERLPTNFYEGGIELLTHTLRLRQHLAMEHWTGNRDLTLFELIGQAFTGRAASSVPGPPESRELTRINGDDDPQRDRDLSEVGRNKRRNSFPFCCWLMPRSSGILVDGTNCRNGAAGELIWRRQILLAACSGLRR